MALLVCERFGFVSFQYLVWRLYTDVMIQYVGVGI